MYANMQKCIFNQFQPVLNSPNRSRLSHFCRSIKYGSQIWKILKLAETDQNTFLHICIHNEQFAYNLHEISINGRMYKNFIPLVFCDLLNIRMSRYDPTGIT